MENSQDERFPDRKKYQQAILVIIKRVKEDSIR
jgi:hypothetical protein